MLFIRERRAFLTADLQRVMLVTNIFLTKPQLSKDFSKPTFPNKSYQTVLVSKLRLLYL